MKASVGAPFAIISRLRQSLAYVYSRKNPNDAHMSKVLTEDEARRIASNIAKLPAIRQWDASASLVTVVQHNFC
jgi:hypothetical protein